MMKFVRHGVRVIYALCLIGICGEGLWGSDGVIRWKRAHRLPTVAFLARAYEPSSAPRSVSFRGIPASPSAQLAQSEVVPYVSDRDAKSIREILTGELVCTFEMLDHFIKKYPLVAKTTFLPFFVASI